MSFDIHFQPCRYDGTTERQLNPFTNQLQDAPRNEPLSQSETEAVRQVFISAGAEAREDDVYTLDLADGASAEIYAAGLEHGCMFAVRGAGVTPLLAQLLFDVLVAGNWVMMGTGHDDMLIAPNEECIKRAPDDSCEVVVAASAGEVEALVNGGFEAWARYRDQVVGRRG